MSAYPELNRKVTETEYDEVINYAINQGIENAFIQEGTWPKKVLSLTSPMKDYRGLFVFIAFSL